MPDAEQQVVPVTGEGVADGEAQWPASMAFWMAWLMPATTARRTARLPLWKAWSVHFTSAVLIVLLYMFLSCWDWHRECVAGFHGWPCSGPCGLVARCGLGRFVSDGSRC